MTTCPVLYSEKALRGVELVARDGKMGRVHELHVDETTWQVRHVVVDIGTWLIPRLVLLEPQALGGLEVDDRSLTTALTCDEIAAAPSAGPPPPAALHCQPQLRSHHDWPVYWSALNPMVSMVTPDSAPLGAGASTVHAPVEPHLLATRDISLYRVAALDDAAGQVDDLLLDCHLWETTSIVVTLGGWWHAKNVVVPTGRICEILRAEFKLTLGVTQAQLQDYPPFAPAEQVLPG